LAGHTLPDTLSVTALDSKRRGWQFIVGILTGLMLAGGLYAAWHFGAYRQPQSADLWRQLFNGRQQILIVVGDAGLNMFENLSRHEVELDEYASRSYLRSPFAQTPEGYTWDPLATRTYTTVQELRLASRLTVLSNAHSDLTRIRFARELSMEDLKGSNAILMGAPQYNPWEHLFDKDMNFTLHYDGVANTITVNNRDPRNGE
jgi:hypothetical protein